MKKSLVGLSLVAAAGCGVFGASDDPKTDTTPMTPEGNSTPPPVGGAAPPGVYVSSSKGTIDGSGTDDRPLKTLSAAFALAKQQGLRVIACAEEFDEAVVVVDGVSAYGYYDCSAKPWNQISERRAIVKSPTSPALLATNIALPTRFEGFEFHGPDLDSTKATDKDGSSIGMEVRGSKGFTIANALVHGGSGAAGTDGEPGAMDSFVGPAEGAPAFDQNYRTCPQPMYTLLFCTSRVLTGPGGGPSTCKIGGAGNPGGAGGAGRWWLDPSTESSGPYDWRGLPFTATAATAAGGSNQLAGGGGYGLPGKNGAQGAEGSDGANGSWKLTAAGFARGNGTAGGAGKPGQGGGGGGGALNWYAANGGAIGNVPGSSYFSTVSGGGGGGGGCGGQPGTPGSGGGASIGALVVDSIITLDQIRIESGTGGRAGKGNLGTYATVGGTGGAAIIKTVAVSGRGGDGGPGGNGGASGHGAPGPSIALAFAGTRPGTTQSVQLVPGPAGAGQPQLIHVATVGGIVGSKSLPAIAGQALAEYQIK